MRDNDAKIAKEVQNVREFLAISQDGCALALGLTESAYARLEAGQERFTTFQLVALADHFNVPLVRFFTTILEAVN
jgi:transcriptional regulator with XRE-family HTH domain